MRRANSIFLILFLFFNCFSGFSQSSNHFIIATGSDGGHYFRVGKHIAHQYNTNFTEKFTSIQTNGSVENIELLKNNFADFAIVQRDVLINSLFDERNGINNIEVIAPLFEEKLIIYTHNNSPVSISKFKNQLLTEEKRIGFTSNTGYSYILFGNVSKFIGLYKPNLKEEFSSYKQLIEDFRTKKIDYIVSFSLPIEEFENKKNINLVYFEEQEISLLENRIPNLFRTNLNNQSNQFTLGSWAFFIGVKNKINQLDNTEKLFTSLYTNSNKNNLYSLMIAKSVLEFKDNKVLKIKYFKGIPSLFSLSNEIGISQNYFKRNILNIGIFIFILLFIRFLIFKKMIPKIRFINLWIRFKHIILGVLVLVFLYFLSIQILRISEQNFYNEIGIKSQLLNLSNNELNFWLLIRNLTGNDNGIFPISSIGKLVLSFNSYILWVGTILIGFLEYIAYQISKKRKRGLMNIKFTNHIVVIGWNETTYSFIKNTVITSNQFNGKKLKVVCLVSNSEEIIEKDKEIKELHLLKKIHFINGEARDTTILESANIHNADSVILLAEDSSNKADERTLLRALAISRFCRTKSLLNENKNEQVVSYKLYETGGYIDSIYIIAEINDIQFKKDLLNADVNEVVITSSYGKNIITQTMFNHGVSKVLDEVLQFNEFNEFYIIDLSDPKNEHLQYKTFDELLLPLRKQKILLLAIKIVYHDKHNHIIIDTDEIKKRLLEEGLEREVIVNPITATEVSRLTDPDDQLIVFTTNKKDLEKQVKLVVFE